ncbi:MAG: DUF2062 domain-containing protein [Magnetococcales bacterium]|nr:DUF2062 domain-containing protein [Magnetococcales bacterium]
MTEPKKKREPKDFFRYQLIRLHRLPADSHDIALGVSFGVMVSFTPFLGFHLLLSTALCLIFGGSKVASWIGTVVGNPLTFPIFFWADYKMGAGMMGMESGSDHFDPAIIENLSELFWPITLGSTILAPLAGVFSYYIAHWFIEATRDRRSEKMRKARRRFRFRRDKKQKEEAQPQAPEACEADLNSKS